MVKIISLSKPITWHGSQLTEIGLKEPTGLQYIRLGEPRLAIASGTGGYWVEQPQVIQDYFEALIDHEGRGALLAQMGMDDAKRLKEALFDFFHAASGTD